MDGTKREASLVTIDAPVDVLKLNEQDFRRLVVSLFEQGHEQMQTMQTAINTNTELTKKNAEDTQEMLSIFKNAKTGAAFFSWCGRAAKWLYPFVFIIALLWAIVHGGKWPDWWPKWGDH
jgi:hypothetical protein